MNERNRREKEREGKEKKGREREKRKAGVYSEEGRKHMKKKEIAREREEEERKEKNRSDSGAMTLTSSPFLNWQDFDRDGRIPPSPSPPPK